MAEFAARIAQVNALAEEAPGFVWRHEGEGGYEEIPLDDPGVYDMLARGGTTGVFQFESSLATDKLRSMKCDRFEDLVATNALIRPGPLDSGMTDIYIRRKLGQEPVRVPVEAMAEVGIDISDLRAQTGAITLDNGYANTGSCTSAITFIDGEKGILRYRGYPIEELAERATFEEVSYLLIWGHLPNKQELEEFLTSVSQETADFTAFLRSMTMDLTVTSYPRTVACTWAPIGTRSSSGQNPGKLTDATAGVSTRTSAPGSAPRTPKAIAIL